MDFVYLVSILAVMQFLVSGFMVGRYRERYGVKAPAISGHEQFERMFRVQMNTMEQIICFLPALLIAAQYWPPGIVAAIGVVYLIGRAIYWRTYLSDPAKRGPGFILTILPTFILVIASLIGIIRHSLS